MKTPTPAPRIVDVAATIHKINVRNTTIDGEVAAINARLDKLITERVNLADQKTMLAREMDKLTT